MMSAGAGWLPVEGMPVGLITWYLPGGEMVAVAVSWLAVVNGQPPELRAGCVHLPQGYAGLPEGADFAINIPADLDHSPLRRLIGGVAASAPFMLKPPTGYTPARSVSAPLLDGCVLQLECAQARTIPGNPNAELAGDICLLRRGGLIVDPASYPDFCALQPLRPVFPS